MQFSFASAAADYASHIHPRLLLGPAELQDLRTRTRTGPGRRLLAAVRQRIAPHVDAILAAEDLPALIERTGRYGGMEHMHPLACHNLALVGLLDDDARAIDAVRRVLDSLPHADERAARAERRHDLLVHGNIFRAIWACDLLHEHLDPAARRRFASWLIHTQVRQVLAELAPRYLLSAGANMRYGKILSAIHAVLTFADQEGVGSLKAERAKLLQCFEATIHAAVTPDGYPEEDVGYGTAFLPLIFLASLALRRAGIFDAFAQHPRLRQSGRALLHFVQPWGEHLTNLGDLRDDFPLRQAVLPVLAHENDDPVLLWLMGAITSPAEVTLTRRMHVPADAVSLLMLPLLGKPVAPAKARIPTAFRDRRRGLISFRSSWHPDATCVTFDGSQRCPAAQGHAHASAGNFTLSAFGDYFAVDTGRYNIEQDQHNLVLVNGASGRSTDGNWVASFQDGVLTGFQPGRHCDRAAADSSHQHNCFWARRTLMLVRAPGAPAYVCLVDDLNASNDWATYWWTLQTSPVNRVRVHKHSATIHGGRSGSSLDVFFAIPAASEYPRPHTLELDQDVMHTGSSRYIEDPGARADAYDDPEAMLHYSVFRRPRLIARVAGYNGRIMSLLIPRPAGRRRPRVRQLPSLDASLALRVTWPDGTEDTLIHAFEHGLLEAADITARGDWCFLRRKTATGHITAWEGGDLRRLEVGGKTIPTR